MTAQSASDPRPEDETPPEPSEDIADTDDDDAAADESGDGAAPARTPGDLGGSGDGGTSDIGEGDIGGGDNADGDSGKGDSGDGGSDATDGDSAGGEPAADDRHPAEDEQALLPVRAEDPPPERARFLGWSRSPAALLVGLLIGLLGFALAVQVRSNTSTSGLPAARQEDLVRILDDLSSREERLRRQIADLESARSRLATAGDTSSTALQEARTRSTALGILAGTVPAQGPGVQLVITDPRRQLAAEDLLDTIEELRAAGAEAIQVGGVRIGLDSSFVATDRGIAVDGVSLAAPYTVLAIGDPPTLATAMSIPGGVADTAKRAGGDARVEQHDAVVIRATRVPRPPRYSEPAD